MIITKVAKKRALMFDYVAMATAMVRTIASKEYFEGSPQRERIAQGTSIKRRFGEYATHDN